MKFKRFLASTLIFIMLLTSVQVFAANETRVTVELPLYNDAAVASYSLADDTESSLKTLVYNAVMSYKSSVDISSLKIAYNAENTEAVRAIVGSVAASPEVFHLLQYSYSYNTYFTTITFTYNCTKKEFEERYSAILDAADLILSGIKDNTSLTDVQKALLIHDRLIVHCEYDYQNLLDNTVPANSYTMYGALVLGVSVCQGYSEAYQYLLDEVGIESRVVSSDALNHAWNVVVINGKEYHVDVTWDDPVWDITGRVNHHNFLLSSNALYADKVDYKNSVHKGHKATDYDTTPTDTTYDNYYWKSSDAEFCLVGSDIYYIDSENAKIKKESDKSVVCDVTDIWRAGENSFWRGNYARLSTDGNVLFYSLSDAVYKLDLNTKTSLDVYEPDLTFGDWFTIYGFTYRDGYFICDINNSPNFKGDTKSNYQVRHLYSVMDSCDHSFDYVCDAECNNGCGYVRPVKHNYIVQYNNEQHYDRCSVCGDRINFAAHSFDAACDTDCNDGCGYVRVTSHDYKTEFDNAQHYEKCSYCGDEKNHTPHTFDNVCDTDCNHACGYERVTSHNYQVYYDNSQHFEKCTLCGDKKNFGDHSFFDACDTDCNDGCGYVRVVSHDYKTAYNSTQHYSKCSICEKMIDFENHSFDDASDTVCNDGCGYERNPSHEFEWVYDDYCSYEKCKICGEEIGAVRHTFSGVCDTDCNNGCGYVRIVPHNYKIKFDSAQHYEKCEICDDEKNFAPHTFDNVCDTDCNDGCGYVRGVTHNYQLQSNNTHHFEKCPLCGDEKNHVLHDYVNYVYNNDATEEKDGTETGTCSCGKKNTRVKTGTKLEKKPEPIIDTTKKFVDVPSGKWFVNAVNYSVTYGIFSGTSDTTFEPNKNMSRAQFVQVFANLSGVDTSDRNVNSGFTDVPKGKWFTGAVAWAAQNKVVSGMGDGTFAPNANVTREQMCVMLVNYVENFQKSTLKSETLASTFADDKSIAGWSKTQVYKCANAKLVNGVGDNKFDPKGNATRAQGATIFSNFHKAYLAD